MTDAPDSLFVTRLKGRELVAVTFVQDYLQLKFDPDPAGLSCYTKVSIRRGGESATFGKPGFADRLLACIGHYVDVAVHDTDRALELHFDNGSVFSAPLALGDYVGPEALQLNSRGDIIIE